MYCISTKAHITTFPVPACTSICVCFLQPHPLYLFLSGPLTTIVITSLFYLIPDNQTGWAICALPPPSLSTQAHMCVQRVVVVRGQATDAASKHRQMALTRINPSVPCPNRKIYSAAFIAFPNSRKGQCPLICGMARLPYRYGTGVFGAGR